MPVQRGSYRTKHFSNGLQEFRFAGIPLLDGIEDLI
jgi:hypothetical protein